LPLKRKHILAKTKTLVFHANEIKGGASFPSKKNRGMHGDQEVVVTCFCITGGKREREKGKSPMRSWVYIKPILPVAAANGNLLILLELS
jgi:hypothetical protein